MSETMDNHPPVKAVRDIAVDDVFEIAGQLYQVTWFEPAIAPVPNSLLIYCQLIATTRQHDAPRPSPLAAVYLPLNLMITLDA